MVDDDRKLIGDGGGTTGLHFLFRHLAGKFLFLLEHAMLELHGTLIPTLSYNLCVQLQILNAQVFAFLPRTLLLLHSCVDLLALLMNKCRIARTLHQLMMCGVCRLNF